MEGENSSTQELELMRQLFGARQTGTATVNVNLGGSGVWIAVTACIATLAACVPMMIVLAAITIDQGRKIERLDDYLNSIFQQIPELRAHLDERKSKAEHE